jgi:mRNA interferase HigB
MQIINLRLISKFSADPDTRRSKTPLKTWRDTVSTAAWTSLMDIKKSYPSVSYVNDQYVFNIGGNKFRLISKIDFGRQMVFITWIGTHADYDSLNLG